MLSLSLSFLAGVYTATFMDVTSPLLPMAIFSCGLLLVACRSSLHFAAFLVGVIYLLASATEKISLRLPPEFSGDSLVVHVVVVDFPTSTDESVRFTARAVGAPRLQGLLTVRWYTPPVSVRLGDEWQLELRLRPPRGLANPGSRDTQALALSRSLVATSSVVNGPRNRLLAPASSRSLFALRQTIVDRLEAVLSTHASLPVLVALAVGSRHLLTTEHWQGFAASGTAHLIAISGLHIGLVAVACSLLGRGLMVFIHCNQRRWSVTIGVFGALAYLMVSGMGLPAQRAFIMLLAVAVCVLLKRRLQGTTLLSLAALCIVVSQPLSIVQPGLWLSFAAVASLFWWSARQVLAPRRPLGLGKLWSAQCTLFFALLPISGLVFGRLSLSAPIANFVAVPIFSLLVVPATLSGILLQGVFDEGLALAAFFVAFTTAVIEQMDGLKPLVVPTHLYWQVALSAAIFVCLPRGFPARLCCVCTIPVLFWPATPGPDVGCIRATFFDVGQGTSILVETRRHALLYDTGPPYGTDNSAFAAHVAPALERLGVRMIDRILVSHADADHAGGIHAAVDRYPAADLLVGEQLPGFPVRSCATQQAWIWDSVLFEVLAPDRTTTLQGNDRSCVLQVTAGSSALLLTGDIEAAGEAELMRRASFSADVVSMPHHGSRTSSTLPFVAALAPRFVVVSAGYQNRFGHPKPDVVRRWQSVSSTVLNTSELGAVRLQLCANQPPKLLSASRDERRNVWHRASQTGQ